MHYLLFTVLGSLLLAGCGNDNSSTSSVESSTTTSSSSSSSKAEAYVPTLQESVAHISDNYTIAYSLYDGGQEYSFRNELELLSFTGAEGNLAYFSEFNEYGYYFTNSDSYIIYNDGYGKPIYTTAGKLDRATVSEVKELLDLNTNFTNADWELDSGYTADKFEFLTRDENALATANFLTDNIFIDEADYVMATVNKKGKNYRIYSFTLFNADGDELTEALVQRVGGSMALDSIPTLNDNLDETFKTKWLIASNYGNDLGKAGDYFEITSDEKLIVYTLDENGFYNKSSIEYTFVAPYGDGSYVFSDASSNLALISYYQGNMLLQTYQNGASSIKYDLCMEYYTYWFLAAADYLGYYVEQMTTDDEYYKTAVTDLGAVRAYYAASMTKDPTTGEEYADELVIVSQFLNQDALKENFCEGDITIYNGFVLGGLIFGNMIGALATEGGMEIMFNISSVLPPEYAPVDFTKYTSKAPVTAGQTSIEYLVSYMEAEGYSYMNKERAAANPTLTINAVTGDATSGLNFNTVINRYLADDAYGIVKDQNGNEVFRGADMYIFYKENPEQDPKTEGDEYLYAGVIITDREVEGFVNFYGNVYLTAMGYFIVSGDIYGALQTWAEAQPDITPEPTSLKKLF